MKTIITSAITLVLLLNTLVSHTVAQSAATGSTATHKLTVVLPTIKQRTGKLHIGLANSQESFDGASIQTKVVDVPASGEVSVTFDSLVAGQYAVRLFQDLNANDKIDFSGQFPNEPFGFSNITMLMGPPAFDQCAFDLTANKTISISLMQMQ